MENKEKRIETEVGAEVQTAKADSALPETDKDPQAMRRESIQKAITVLCEKFPKAFSLKQEEWNQFLADVENAYRAYVGPQNSIDLLGQYGKTSVENANSASNISLFAFWLPLFLIIAMVIKFFMELLGEEGIVLSGGWWSLGFFVVLIIWVSIGNSGRYCTCANCHKWNSLKLDGDYIIDSRDTWKTKKYYENGRNYSKQVPIRVEKHEEHYTCEHCGNKEIKYRTTEREL